MNLGVERFYYQVLNNPKMATGLERRGTSDPRVTTPDFEAAIQRAEG